MPYVRITSRSLGLAGERNSPGIIHAQLAGSGNPACFVRIGLVYAGQRVLSAAGLTKGFRGSFPLWRLMSYDGNFFLKDLSEIQGCLTHQQERVEQQFLKKEDRRCKSLSGGGRVDRNQGREKPLEIVCIYPKGGRPWGRVDRFFRPARSQRAKQEEYVKCINYFHGRCEYRHGPTRMSSLLIWQHYSVIYKCVWRHSQPSQDTCGMWVQVGHDQKEGRIKFLCCKARHGGTYLCSHISEVVFLQTS